MHHSFFIHLSVDGHLCYFHVLAIVNSAAMCVFQLWFSQGICLLVGLLGPMWFFSVLLICIVPVVNDIEQLLMCLLAICMYSLEKCLFRCSVHFLIGLFVIFDVELYEFFVYF